MPKPNHVCLTCGEEYYTCNACDRFRSWRINCDTPECYQVLSAFLDWRDNGNDDAAFANTVDYLQYDIEKLNAAMREVYDRGEAFLMEGTLPKEEESSELALPDGGEQADENPEPVKGVMGFIRKKHK